MKTTKGKTKSVKPGRVIQIFAEDRMQLLAVRAATSLKDGLVGYFEETLKPMGYTKPLYNGNVLTVTYRRRNTTYIAKDVSK